MSFLTNHEALVFCHFLCGSEENLRAAFCKLGVGHHALEDVVDKAPNRHYQVIQLPAVFRFALRCFCFFIFLNIKVFLLIVNMATCAVGMRLSILICPWPVLWCRYVMNHPNQYLSDSQKILHSKVYILLLLDEIPIIAVVISVLRNSLIEDNFNFDLLVCLKRQCNDLQMCLRLSVLLIP